MAKKKANTSENDDLGFVPTAPISGEDDLGFVPETKDAKNLPVFDPASYIEAPMSTGRAAGIKTEEGLTFGARPFVAGIGGGIGGGLAKLTSPRELSLAQRLQEAAGAAKSGFNEERLNAQQEQEQASEQLGPMASGAIGLGTGLLTAPLTPVRSIGGALKLGAALGAGKALGEANSPQDAAEDIAGGAAGAGLLHGASNYAGKGLAAISARLKKGAINVGSALSGISKKNIETYSKNIDKIDNQIKDIGGNIAEASDKLRQSWQDSIASTRRALGEKISSALEASSPEKSIKLNPYIEEINKVRDKINPKLYPEQLAEFDDIVKKASALADENGNISAKELNELKDFFQDAAKSSYQKNGQIFSRGKEVAQGAKVVAAKMNKDIRQQFPEIKEANAQLSRLHILDENINKNLITPEKSEWALLSAGGGINSRSAKNLQKLGELTNRDMLSEAEQLSATKAFTDPDILPIDATGKAGARQTLGRTIGAGLGSMVGAGVGGPVGAGAGAVIGSTAGNMLSSPAFLKSAIRSANIPAKVFKGLGGETGVNKLMSSENGRSLLIQQLSPYLNKQGQGLLRDEK